VFNRKLAKCIKINEHCTLINIDLNMGLFTNHGLHLNGLGKDVIPKQLVSHIYAWLLEEATIPVGLGWKIEPSNIVLDEGSPTAVTDSSMEVISPIKLNVIHLLQNSEPASTKTVANRMFSRKRRIPVGRNENFLW
jgi:hypothetical protein